MRFYLKSLIVILLLDLPFTTTIDCPNLCTCSTNIKIVKCSGRKDERFSRLHFSGEIEQLYLNKFNDTTIRDLQFNLNFQDLLLLDLSNNKLENIEKCAFQGLSKLQTLNLQRNNISKLTNDCLNDLVNLKKIILNDNNLQIIPDAIFSLNNLKSLHLHGNNISKIKFIKKLPYLHRLILSNNPIDKIESNDFTNISMCQTIYLSHCKIKNIQHGSFNLILLKSLKLDFNLLNEDSLNVLNDLNTLESLNLDGLNFTNTHKIYNHLPISLLHLSLAHNKIESISIEVGKRFLNLQTLDLSHNDINDLRFLNDMKQLRVVKLSHNQITEFPDNLPSKLLSLNLKENKIKNIDFLFPTSKVKNLDLSYNKISLINLDSFNSLDSLEFLNLQSNKIEEIKTQFSNIPNLKTLNLRENNCKHLLLNSFEGLNNLEVLLLSKNRLNNIIETDIDGIFLESLPKLVQLDFGSNSLSEIPLKAFQALSNLQNLTLQNNSISILPSGLFNELKSLKFLDLSQNLISSISSLSHINSLESLKWLNLASNPFICVDDEKNSPLVKNSNLTLLYHENYTCTFPNDGRNEKLMTFLKSPITINTRLIDTFYNCGFYLIVIMVITLIYFFHENIKFMIFRMQNKEETDLIVFDFEFDAYVSCSDNYIDWVYNYLELTLQGNEGQHYRKHYSFCSKHNFNKNISRFANIKSFVKRSRKVIVIWSKEFKNSQENLIELKNIIKNNKCPNDIILIEMDEYTDRDDSVIQCHSFINTFITWESHLEKHELFWVNLYKALDS